MKNQRSRMHNFFTLFLVAISCPLFAQNDYEYPSLSPKGAIEQVVGHTTIRVVYERPAVRGRTIFGELVPWNKVWRTGAGYCTKVLLNRAVRVGGQYIAAGAYSLHTIPNPDQWMVIFNRDTTLYGSYGYDPDKDAARFTVRPQKTHRFYEALTIDLDLIPNDAKMYISWANTQISFLIDTSTDEDVYTYFEKELGKSPYAHAEAYTSAGGYLFYQRQDMQKALEYANKALELNPNIVWAPYLKIDIYDHLKLYDKALEAVEDATRLTKKRSYDKEEYREEDMQNLRERYLRIQEKKLGLDTK